MINKVSQFIFLVLLGGCASIGIEDLFSGYAQQMQKARNAQQQGQYLKAEQLVVSKSPSHNSYVLTLLEKGRLQYLQKNYVASSKSFTQAYQLIEAQQAKAKIQISRGVEKMGAVVSNDSVIRYQVPAYEQTMLHTYQALNYTQLGDFEAAMVEIRRANIVQDRAMTENQAALNDAEHDYNERALQQNYPSMEQLVSGVKNGFQNAYTFYLSGVFYEAQRLYDDAYIDYKRALEIYPENNVLQQEVLRLAKQLNMYDDYKKFSQRYGEYTQSWPSESGDVVIFVAQELVMPRQEIRSNLPIFRHDDIRFFSFSLPTYRGNLLPPTPLVIEVDDTIYASENVVRLQSLAAKQLQEQLPSMVARQAVRLVAKEQMRRKMNKEAGDVGNILMSLYNVASEHADTRSWLSLPENVQILRLRLPIGQQNVPFTLAGQRQVLSLDVKKQGLTMVNIEQIGGNTQTQISQL